MKKIYKYLLIIMIACLTACASSENVSTKDNEPKNIEVSKSKYTLDTKISDLDVSYDYLARRGVIGILDSVYIRTFPFLTTSTGRYAYVIGKEFDAVFDDAIYYNKKEIPLDNRLYLALSSNMISLNPKSSKVYDGGSFYSYLHNKIASDFGDGYVSITMEDYRYASQLAILLFAGYIDVADFVKIDKYFDGTEYQPSHSEIESSDDVETLYREILSMINSINSSLTTLRFPENSKYFSSPSQIGDGYFATLPIKTVSKSIILPITGDITICEGTTFAIQQMAFCNEQSFAEVSLSLNKNGNIPVPENSGISQIVFCDEKGNLVDHSAKYDNGVLVDSATHIMINISDMAAFNSWIASNPNTIFTIKSSSLGLYYLDNVYSFANADRQKDYLSVQEIGYPAYNSFEVKVLNLCIPDFQSQELFEDIPNQEVSQVDDKDEDKPSDVDVSKQESLESDNIE